MTQKPFIRVAVGVLINTNGEILLAQRPEGKPWSGWWEFPGGKIEDQESVHQALARELKEELDIDIEESFPWVQFIHEYPTTRVELSFRQVFSWKGTIRGAENQAFAWTSPQQASTLGDILPASIAPLKWLSLPPLYAISHFGENPETYWSTFEQQLQQGIKFFQFREPLWKKDKALFQSLFERMLEKCHQHDAKLLVNSMHPREWIVKADGIQVQSQEAILLEERPLAHDKLVGISCHHLADVLYAQRLEADFILLGHVAPTPSHPSSAPLTWEVFEQFAQEAACPVFAVGGQSPQDLLTPRRHGAHGIAFIRG